MHIAGIPSDRDQVEVEILDNEQKQWWSEATPQFMTVTLMSSEENNP